MKGSYRWNENAIRKIYDTIQALIYLFIFFFLVKIIQIYENSMKNYNLLILTSWVEETSSLIV